MILTLIYIAASVAFWAGVAADASSSVGQMEGTKMFRDATGRFSLWRYLLTMGGMWATTLVIMLVGDDAVYTIMASVILVVGAVLRFRVAAKNRALNKARAK